MWKDASGRWFDRKTASRLLQEKSIEDLHGSSQETVMDTKSVLTSTIAGKL